MFRRPIIVFSGSYGRQNRALIVRKLGFIDHRECFSDLRTAIPLQSALHLPIVWNFKKSGSVSIRTVGTSPLVRESVRYGAPNLTSNFVDGFSLGMGYPTHQTDDGI